MHTEMHTVHVYNPIRQLFFLVAQRAPSHQRALCYATFATVANWALLLTS